MRRALAWPFRIHFCLGHSARTVVESGALCEEEWRRAFYKRRVPRAVGPISQAWETLVEN